MSDQPARASQDPPDSKPVQVQIRDFLSRHNAGYAFTKQNMMKRLGFGPKDVGAATLFLYDAAARGFCEVLDPKTKSYLLIDRSFGGLYEWPPMSDAEAADELILDEIAAEMPDIQPPPSPDSSGHAIVARHPGAGANENEWHDKSHDNRLTQPPSPILPPPQQHASRPEASQPQDKQGQVKQEQVKQAPEAKTEAPEAPSSPAAAAPSLETEKTGLKANLKTHLKADLAGGKLNGKKPGKSRALSAKAKRKIKKRDEQHAVLRAASLDNLTPAQRKSVLALKAKSEAENDQAHSTKTPKGLRPQATPKTAKPIDGQSQSLKSDSAAMAQANFQANFQAELGAAADLLLQIAGMINPETVLALATPEQLIAELKRRASDNT